MNTESFNTNLLDNLTTAVVVLDADLCLYYLNSAAEALLETSGKSRHSTYIGEILTQPKETIKALRNVQANGNTFIARKVTLHLANQHKLTVDYSICPIEQGLLIVEIQELDRSYHITRKETLLSNHETTLELVRSLGHEIKNPLGGIRGAAQLLSQELPTKELQDYTNVIIEEADRLVNLVDRLTTSYKQPSMTAVNIHEVLERVRNLVEAESQGSLKIRLDYDPSIPEILGDLEQLIQAALNIVRNAMQALMESDQQIDQPTITFRTRTLSHTTIATEMHKLVASIEIIDNGPGIKPDLIENIFYPLISGRASGTGLGLSIAQTILKNHDGLVECESQPGQTKFTMLFPLTTRGLANDN